MATITRNHQWALDQVFTQLVSTMKAMRTHYASPSIDEQVWMDLLLTKQEQNLLDRVQALGFPTRLYMLPGNETTHIQPGAAFAGFLVSARRVPFGTAGHLYTRLRRKEALEFANTMRAENPDVFAFAEQASALMTVAQLLFGKYGRNIAQLAPDLAAYARAVVSKDLRRHLDEVLAMSPVVVSFARHPQFIADLEIAQPLLFALSMNPTITPKDRDPVCDQVVLTPHISDRYDASEAELRYKTQVYSLDD